MALENTLEQPGAKIAFQYLAEMTARQNIEKRDRFRHLVSRKILPTIGIEIGGQIGIIDGRVVLRRDQQDRFAPFLVLDTDRRAFGNMK